MTERNAYIVCPHCEEEDHEHSEYPGNLEHDGDTAKVECNACRKAFAVTLSVSYDYGCSK